MIHYYLISSMKHSFNEKLHNLDLVFSRMNTAILLLFCTDYEKNGLLEVMSHNKQWLKSINSSGIPLYQQGQQ